MTEKSFILLEKARYALSVLWYYLKGLYDRVSEHHAFLLASGLSFSIFICIVPLVLIIFSVLGNLFESPSIVHELDAFIDRIIPYPEYAADVKAFVEVRIEEFTVYKSVAGIVGGIGVFFAASGLFSSMRTILNMVFRVPKGELIFIGKLRDFGLVLLVLVFFLVSILLLPAIGIVKDLTTKIEFLNEYQLSHLEGLFFLLLSFIIIWLVFFVVYFMLPKSRQNKKVLLVSSLSAAILWHIAERIFGYYIANFLAIRQVYGTYAFLIVVAFWIYYSSLLFIIGAEIGQLFRERQSELSFETAEK
ncbi:MAG: YihY/virulence factor BrkB family protein [candidate division Zixibacteria bacterium]|nr:YihY/virulence factor BrkB family protein [candidate division Zixibacteria bacterium]